MTLQQILKGNLDMEEEGKLLVPIFDFNFILLFSDEITIQLIVKFV